MKFAVQRETCGFKGAFFPIVGRLGLVSGKWLLASWNSSFVILWLKILQQAATEKVKYAVLQNKGFFSSFKFNISNHSQLV